MCLMLGLVADAAACCSSHAHAGPLQQQQRKQRYVFFVASRALAREYEHQYLDSMTPRWTDRWIS